MATVMVSDGGVPEPRGGAARRGRRGQGTVEYLMMLAVLVGMILVLGKMFKPQISGVFNDVMRRIQAAIEEVTRTN